MKQRKPKPVAWILAVLGTLALLTPRLSVTLADGGTGFLFEMTEPLESEAVADGPAPGDSQTSAAGVPPLINVWYGSSQVFGHLGDPQRRISILGRVSDGNGVKSLKYSLNGDAQQSLSVGPDGRRLASKGDFNIELNRNNLYPGINKVVIVAQDTQGNQSAQTVTLQYEPDNVWPVRYAIDWSEISDIQQVAQVVDGLWELTPEGIRTKIRGYDRLVAIGDMIWSDYEVTVPVTVHSRGSSGSPGVGILMRWKGHTDNPVSGWQPKSGWYPLGALGWYRWYDSGGKRFHIYGNHKRLLDSTNSKKLKLNVPYVLKMRVETKPGKGGFYRLKMWRADEPEPSGWDLKGQEALNDPQTGSFLLLAHQTDVTFGDVQVRPVGDVYALAIDTVGQGTVDREANSAAYAEGEVVRLSPLPAKGWVFENWSGADSDDLTDNGDGTWSLEMVRDRSVTANFGPGCYTLSLSVEPSDSGSVETSQPPNCGGSGYTWGTQLQLTARPEPGFTLGRWSGNLFGHASPEALKITGDMSVEAIFVESAVSYEEGFEGYEPGSDPDGWYDTQADNSTVQDDGLFQVYDLGETRAFGTQSEQSNIHSHYVEAGSEGWSSFRYMGRMMITSQDSGVGVTFYSKYADEDVYYRLRRHDGTAFHLASHPHSSVALDGDTDTGVKPRPDVWYWFLVEIGNTGTQTEIRAKVWPEGTPEPEDWQVNARHGGSGRLTHGRIGVWSYSSGSKYWDDLLAHPVTPIQYWDLEVKGLSRGAVGVAPEQAQYADGQEVTLTATGEPGWRFERWGGDLSGSENPGTVTMDGDKIVEAVFVEETYTLRVEVTGDGAVEVSPEKETYGHGEKVELSALAGAGWHFAGWSGDAAGSESSISITMDGDKRVAAAFSEGMYSLSIDTEGEGSVSKQPDKAVYRLDEKVTLAAEGKEGWHFDHWDGDLGGSDSPATVGMDGDKAVLAVFVMKEYTLTPTVVGRGRVTVTPQKAGYHFGDAVQVEAIADGGWVFTGWSGALSGLSNPATIEISGDAAVTATFEQVPWLYAVDFEGYAEAADPAGWYDTKAGNSMQQDNRLFKVYDLEGNKAFGTQSTQKNIHSHYVGAGSEDWSDLRFRGRMLMTSTASGLGVTAYSQYADRDIYYRLRRYGDTSFHLAPHPHSTVILEGDVDTGIKPEPNLWYWFVLEVEDAGARTQVRAKVWPEGTEEPADWQVHAWHKDNGRLLNGRVGLWSYSSGSKYWDDLVVEPY